MSLLKTGAAILLASTLCVPAQAQDTTGLRGMGTANDALAWQAVGRLDADDIGFCTGTLISPEYVLTAAHCVFSKKSGSAIKPEDLTFQAGLRNGRVAARRAISQIEVHEKYRPMVDIDRQNIRHDVALLRLSQPIPTSELDPFILHENEVTSGAVSVVSYGRGRENVPSRQDVCQVVVAQAGIMGLDCDVTFGSSGAPVFTHVKGRGQIVSVISGMTVYDGRRMAYGMSLPDIIAVLKHQMWANKPKPVATITTIEVGGDTQKKGAGGAKFIRLNGS